MDRLPKKEARQEAKKTKVKKPKPHLLILNIYLK